MPGVLSSIFDPNQDGAESQHDTSVTAVDTGTDFGIDQQIGLDVAVSWQDAQGGTHSWQMENDVGVNVDVGATVTAVLGTEDSTASEF